MDDVKRNEKRFIGDKSTKKVHDLKKDICIVPEEEAVAFDSLPLAHADGYVNCGKCLSSIFIDPPFLIDGPGNIDTSVILKMPSSSVKKDVGGHKVK